jgi:hypothetical protein
LKELNLGKAIKNLGNEISMNKTFKSVDKPWKYNFKK